MTNISRLNKFLIMGFILFLNCSKNQESRFEQDIYNAIFNELIESTVQDYRALVVPSPADFENPEAIKKLNERIENKKKEKRSPLIIRVNDSVKEKEDKKYLFEKIKKLLSLKEYQSLINNPKNKNRESFKINISTLEIDKNKYELIYESSLEKVREILDDKERLSGICYLSRILFNEERTIGVFSLSVVHSGLDGIGVFVLIKKENDKWVIDKIIEDWVS